MGFDNECILNIQSLAGEYFCPVCRLLVYPNEAIQSQCTHLYCKPCLTYVVGTTRACPYDGYLVTEATSKPLTESNKALAETIGKIAVHCLFHLSGCTWQGPLSDCPSHCSGCVFGNYPVACNRCGIQIVHKQVQEHAQNCPGVQSQVQQTEVSQVASAQATNLKQAVGQVGAVLSQPQIPQTPVTAPALVPSQQANPQAQTVPAVVPTPGQMIQQHQQYQQYPGYDPFQQQYQQYYPYQQQTAQQYQQQPAGQAHSQYPTQPQPQPQLLPLAPPQPLNHVQASMPVPLQNHQINPPHQIHQAVHPQAQVPAQSQPPAQGNLPPQPQPQPQSYPMMSHSQQVSQVPQYQQPHSQMQQSLPQAHLQPQSQPHPLPQPLPQSQPQFQHHSQPQPQLHPSQPNQPPPNMQHQSAHAVSGHQSYQQPQPQQHSMNQQPQLPPQMQTHFPQQHAQGLPPQSLGPTPNQQPPIMFPNPSQGPNSSAQQPLHPSHQPGHPIYQPGHPHQPNQIFPFAGQPANPGPNHFHQHGGFDQQQLPMQTHLRPQAPFPPQHSSARPRSQAFPTAAIAHGTQITQSHNHAGRPMFPKTGTQSQPFPQPLGGNQTSVTPSYPIKTSNLGRASDEHLGQQITQPLTGRDKPLEMNSDRREIEQCKVDKHENEDENVTVSDAGVKKEQPINHVDKSAGNGKDQKDVAIDPSVQVEKHLKVNKSQGQAENLQEGINFSKDNDMIVQPKSAQTAKADSSALSLAGDSSSSLKGKNLPKSPLPQVDEGRGLPPPPGQIQSRAAAGPFPNLGSHWPPPSNYGPLVPSMLQTGPPAPPQLVQGPGFHASQPRPDDPRYLGNAGQPLNHHEFLQPFGRGPGHLGPSQRSVEVRSGAQELYGHRMGPSYAGGPMNAYHEPVGGPLMGVLPPPPPFDPHGGTMARAAKHGHEHLMGQHHFNRGYLDGRQPEVHHLDSLKRGPFAFNSGFQANMTRLNRPPGPDPLFRSSYIQDSGFYNNNMEAFDNPRKRKPTGMGWCRICKIDCETMESLEHHSQTKEHQNRAMDMARYIKQNSKKNKMMAANDFSGAGAGDARKSKGVIFENRRNRH